jgi:hypothetical protein
MFQHLVHEWTPEKIDASEVAVKVGLFSYKEDILEAGAPERESCLRS